MGKLYVAHQVLVHKSFSSTAFAHDLIGCNLKVDYRISKKAVFVERDKNGKYFYSDSRKECKVVDPNDMIPFIETVGCYRCPKGGLYDGPGDCPYEPGFPDEILGIVDIQPIFSFTNTDSKLIRLAIQLVKEYNESIDNEYVPVNDDNYVRIVRTIDQGLSKTKSRKK